MMARRGLRFHYHGKRHSVLEVYFSGFLFINGKRRSSNGHEGPCPLEFYVIMASKRYSVLEVHFSEFVCDNGKSHCTAGLIQRIYM